mmetsp:Transcript_94488/g.225167  ORF Transcript_94488/g.225167 Transcript_94488/m.225167 type:complete len:298 (-) Transcript_94488:1773-2666(-)
MVVLLVDARLTTESDFVILFLCQLLLIHLFQLFNLSIGILLQLCQCLLMVLESHFLFLDDPVHGLSVHPLDLLGILLHLLNDARMLCQESRVLSFPFLLFALQIRLELLVTLILNNHLLVKGLLLPLEVPCVALFQSLDMLFILHLHFRLLLPKHLELPPLRLNLFAVLLLHLRHLLLVEAVPVSQLEGDAAVQLLNLPLQLQQHGLLLVQELPRHQDLVGISKARVLVSFAGSRFLNVEDAKAAVVAGAEQVQLIPCDPDPGDRSRVCLVLHVVPSQGKGVAAQGARHVWLGHSCD